MKPLLSKEAISRLLGTNPVPTPAPAKKEVVETIPYRQDFDRWFKPTIPKSTIDAIRKDRKSGMKLDDISLKHGVSKGYVSRICSNHSRHEV